MNYYDRSLDALMHAYGRYNVTFDHGDSRGGKPARYWSGRNS